MLPSCVGNLNSGLHILVTLQGSEFSRDANSLTFQLTTGQLLTIISAHYQPISKLQFVSDGSALVSAGDDGVVQVWLLTE